MKSQVLGNQSIGCNVDSCAYNESQHCSLQSIQVAPCKNCQNGNPEDESMCASYQSKLQ